MGALCPVRKTKDPFIINERCSRPALAGVERTVKYTYRIDWKICKRSRARSYRFSCKCTPLSAHYDQGRFDRPASWVCWRTCSLPCMPFTRLDPEITLFGAWVRRRTDFWDLRTIMQWSPEWFVILLILICRINSPYWAFVLAGAIVSRKTGKLRMHVDLTLFSVQSIQISHSSPRLVKGKPAPSYGGIRFPLADASRYHHHPAQLLIDMSFTLSPLVVVIVVVSIALRW